jgi:hypothetical protein
MTPGPTSTAQPPAPHADAIARANRRRRVNRAIRRRADRIPGLLLALALLLPLLITTLIGSD